MTTRKLAAIVFTDIAGYTALSAKDETKAAALIRKQKELLKPIVEKYGGKWLKEIGDGLLLSFRSATGAVECAIKIQKTVKEIDDLNLRIGIHQGEVIEQENDIIGDDVNVASRIEPFSAIGGIAISDKIYRDIASNPLFNAKYIGQPKLKGILQDVKIYCITSHELPPTKLKDVSAKLEKRKPTRIKWLAPTAIILAGILYFAFPKETGVPSVGILPIENIGKDENEFWGRGITEDLIIEVASAGLIRVTPMQKIIEAVNSGLSFDEIAEKLRVKYLLTSSIHKIENNFDLRTQLIEAKTGKSVYAKKWSEPASNVGLIIEKLAEIIISELDIEVIESIKKDYIPDPQAYEFYQRANYYHQHENQEELHIKRSLLLKAIEIDERLIEARQELGFSYRVTGEYDKSISIYNNALEIAERFGRKKDIGWILHSLGDVFWQKGDLEQAIEYGTKALVIFKEIGSIIDLKSALFNLGNIYSNSDYHKAIDYYKEVLEIDREMEKVEELVTDYYVIGETYQRMDELDTALEYLEHSMDLAEKTNDETSMDAILTSLGDVYKKKGDTDKALEHYELALESSDHLEDIPLERIAFLYWQKREYDIALQYFNRILDDVRNRGEKDWESNTLSNIGAMYHAQGDLEMALDYHFSAVEIEISIDRQWSLAMSYQAIGTIYRELNQIDKAIEYYNLCTNTDAISGTADPRGRAFHELGEISYEQGDYSYASEYFESAIKLWEEIQELKQKVWTLSWWAVSEVKNGRFDVAKAKADETEILMKSTNPHDEDFVAIYWNLSQVYTIVSETEKADDYLVLAYKEVQKRADNITNEDNRISFLENTRVNREVVAAWEGLENMQ